MSNQRNAFLAGIAAAALLAGTGSILAPAAAQDHKATAQAAQPNAQTQPMNAGDEAGTAGGAGGKAEPEGKSSQGAGETDQQVNRGNKANKGKMGENQAAPGERTKAQTDHAAEERHMQGNAESGNAKLTAEQRTRVRQTIIDARGAPKVGRLNFHLRVGTVVPRGRIHIIPVPETLVQIDPGWRGLRYFVFHDEVVIVNPRDMRIVAVLPV